MGGFFSYDSTAGPEPRPQTAAEAAPLPPILGELSNEQWQLFIAHAARRRYPAGACVIEAGERQSALCFIASGHIELTLGTGPVQRRGEGELLGLLSFLDGAPSAARACVSVDGPAELLLLTPDALQQLAAWQPRIALMLLRDLGAHAAARLRRLQPAD
ncbi:MAG: cyclic nucleotide-binding domain-containing protein [Burkholderiaceae bacterium]|nr:cyclic nucleotide-binding domain-containing protein [Burkholderiaceae bacterium]